MSNQAAFLKTLFGSLEEKHIWFGNKFERTMLSDAEFFCIHSLIDYSSRSIANTEKPYTYYLMEFDKAPLEQQEAALEQIIKGITLEPALKHGVQVNISDEAIKPTSVVYSGGKSYHVIYRLTPTDDIAMYKANFLALSEMIESIVNLQVDPSCSNPNRLSRLGGATRSDTSKEQRIVYLAQSQAEYESEPLRKLFNIKPHYVESNPLEKEIDSNINKSEFEILLSQHKGLRTAFDNAPLWAAPVGMYGNLFRLACWAIESTGVPYHTLSKYMDSTVFRSLREVGYPEEKLLKPIKHAYAYKNK